MGSYHGKSYVLMTMTSNNAMSWEAGSRSTDETSLSNGVEQETTAYL